MRSVSCIQGTQLWPVQRTHSSPSRCKYWSIDRYVGLMSCAGVENVMAQAAINGSSSPYGMGRTKRFERKKFHTTSIVCVAQ